MKSEAKEATGALTAIGVLWLVIEFANNFIFN